MVETSNQITHKYLDVTFIEKKDTLAGERTNFGGVNFIHVEDIVDPDAEGGYQADYVAAYFTTGPISGLTAQYSYRRVRVPTQTEPFVIPAFFTNIEIGFAGQFRVIERYRTDAFVDYDLFFSFEPGIGTLVPQLDLYVQTQIVPPIDTIVQYPDFPNSTDPVQGGNSLSADNGTNELFDTFLLSLPAP